jgi:rhamnogalacturonan endolyase
MLVLRYLSKRTRGVLLLIAAVIAILSNPVSSSYAAPLTVTVNASDIVVNTGAGLVYTINQYGDLTSAKMNGTETLSYHKPSYLNSGMWPGTVSYELFESGQTVLITIATDAYTHYYASRQGENTLYMATNVIQDVFGEFRYIFRGDGSVLTHRVSQSTNEGSTGPIESGDVYGHADGRTTSKYYGNERAMDLAIKGVTGDGVGVFMAYGNREKSSGGPFFRDIQFQDAEVYNYMYSGHNQTEPMRMGSV